MGHATQLAPPIVEEPIAEPVAPRRRELAFRFQSLVLTDAESNVKHRGATVTLSLVIHAALIAAAITVPLILDDFLPAPDQALRAFFVAPTDMAPPPPPPPPPPAGARSSSKAPAAPAAVEPGKFTAPIEVPDLIKPDEGIQLGLEGGVPGGVEGGVPGGVVGGIVGGLVSAAAAPPPPRVVRVGGKLVAPKLVYVVKPDYPELARNARLTGIVILEAWVDRQGKVKEVKVLRGAPLLDDPAMAAVRQWRYQPLLLNGEPTEFILTVTCVFRLDS